MIQKGKVEPHVVAHDHTASEELEEGREHLADPGRLRDHGVTDPGEGGDRRWDPLVGPDERLIGGEQLATPETGRRHLGEGRRRRRPSGGLHVEDHEGDLAQGCSEVVEGPLDGGTMWTL